MKKLFALVLTLALVFAVAAPAMAASWGDTPAGTTTDPVPFGVSVKLLQNTATTAPDGSSYYAEYPANLGVVANTPVRFMVTISVPTQAEMLAYYGLATLPAGALTATVKLANIKTIVKDSTGDTEFATDGTAITVTMPTLTTTDDSFKSMFTGVITATKDSTVTATVAYNGSLGSGLTKTVGTTTYTITAAGISAGTVDTLGYRALELATPGTDDLVTGWELHVGTATETAEYTVANGPVFVYQDGLATPPTDTVVDSGDAAYAALLAAYNELTGVLGFKYGDKVYYSSSNILAFFGFAGSVSDAKTYKAYTASLTVTDGSNVPNTGDSVSVIGFVMVGLALLATAAVVVKKVRA